MAAFLLALFLCSFVQLNNLSCQVLLEAPPALF
jgi:hypothetical protein